MSAIVPSPDMTSLAGGVTAKKSQVIGAIPTPHQLITAQRAYNYMYMLCVPCSPGSQSRPASSFRRASPGRAAKPWFAVALLGLDAISYSLPAELSLWAGMRSDRVPKRAATSNVAMNVRDNTNGRNLSLMDSRPHAPLNAGQRRQIARTEGAMAPDTQQKLLAVLKPLFPEGATLRVVKGTEPDTSGGELFRVRIDLANDAINLRIPRQFLDDHRHGTASTQKGLEERLAAFVRDRREAFRPNPGPRLRPVVVWTFPA